MFAHYIDETRLFYDFEFIGQNERIEKVLYPSYTEPLQAKDRLIRRFFFNKVYGSVEESSFSNFKEDTADQLSVRLEDFFAAYFRYLQADTLNIKTVRLEVHQYDNTYVLKEKHIVGHYDISTGKFIHTWKNSQ
ncbi:hypothetical protein GXP67_35840 [Rhodocytophaga rosea]|uniref:Uncharacterized protein n=1 Tax=Rhodocytophaga rosea TaxID=2704465 RepID=A0A6C0GVS3_9BACT|nr:hypothetical protein [Rhodocytophaga rosea]QHT71663.1 hypothetical protein GXP67_35840 [Rhodocytophaga rosea]